MKSLPSLLAISTLVLLLGALALVDQAVAAATDETEARAVKTAQEQPLLGAEEYGEGSPEGIWEELVERVPDIKQYAYLASRERRDYVPKPSEAPTLRQVCSYRKSNNSNMRQRVCFTVPDQMDATERARIQARMFADGVFRCQDRSVNAASCVRDVTRTR